MREIFEVVLSAQRGACAFLNLPATPYAVQDAVSRLELDEGEVPAWDLGDRYGFDELSGRLGHDGSLLELNALAQKLSEMDNQQKTAFAGLLAMEPGNGSDPLPLSRLIDLACSAESCEVIDAMNDGQLGRYYAENGSVPSVKDIPADAFDLLDFDHIGRIARARESGTFVERTMEHPGGYVARPHSIKQAYKELDLTPKELDYAILLELSKGFFNDPNYDSGKTVRLKLPADQDTINAALVELDVADWDEVGWTCLDCRVPSLAETVTDEEDPAAIIAFARQLDAVSDDQLTVYKALLEAVGCDSLDSASALTDGLSQYTLSPQPHDPEGAAEAYLGRLLPEKELEYIRPHLDWAALGQALLADSGDILTGYGLIERKDGQPVLAVPGQDGSQRGGMDFA